MKKLFIIFAIFLELNTKIITTKNDEDAIEFKLGETILFNSGKNYFKFNNNEISTMFIIFKFGIDSLNLIDPNKDSTILECNYYYESFIISFNLSMEGIYYLEFNSKSNIYSMFDNSFTTFISGQIIDTIDLSLNIYYSNFKIETISDSNSTLYSIYKVTNLTENKHVFFNYEKSFYFEDNYINPFEICYENNTNCITNVTYYKFMSGLKYIIKIHFVPNYYYKNYYFYFPFSFFIIKDNSLQYISQGYYISYEPKMYIINLGNNTNQSLYCVFEDCQKIFISQTYEEISENNLDNLSNLFFEEYLDDEFTFNSTKYGIIVILPILNNNISSKVAIADNILNDLKNEDINISNGKTLIINIKNSNNSEEEEEDDKENLLGLYNSITAFKSSEKNMIFIKNEDNNKNTDFLFHNSQYSPIFINSSENDNNIQIKTYYPKYAYFDAINPTIFKGYLSNFIKNHWSYEFTDLKEVFPLNIRVNSNLNTFSDFFNLYYYNFKDNINLYINQYYGETDLYECNTDLIKNNDLSVLQNPILLCNDKKSIFNRLITFKDKKLFSGYIKHNSYFDIYLDLNDDNTNITISSFSKGINNSTSKYLKKDKEYIIDFQLNHLIKLDPKFNAEITIYNNIDCNVTLNSKNQTAKLEGNNYKIMSNEDVMIYFYGKIFNNIRQIKINVNNSNKNIEITSNKKIFFTIDVGFEGYNPLNIELFTDSKIRENTIIHIDNIYDKIKQNNNLVDNENLYLYYGTNDNNNYTIDDVEIVIKETDDNIKNNKYNLNVISAKDSNKSLIIYNLNIQEIMYQVNFCKNDQTVTMYYEAQSKSENILIFNKTNNSYVKLLDKYGTKIKFESNEDFVFSYSFKDYADYKIDKYKNWKNEREEEFDKLEINDITFFNNELLKIQFKPNYKNSNTRYIIIIAAENENNNIDNFSNPCYITKLVIDEKKGIKIINIFDIGEKDLIEVEVNITEIKSKDNKYVVNIISQELRFHKKINYYTPKNITITDESKDSKIDSNSKTYIIFITILGILILIIFIFFIYRNYKGRKDEIKTINLKEEELMCDIN